ncbi:MAG TPA: ABC transporter permease subunit [Bdellovibrionales bacterium]|nr:ABC transporter permease subunit [Bdellovibrionales bacterium]
MKIFKSDLAQKRWRRFKEKRTSVAAAILLGIFLVFSLTAELWANSQPLLMSYKGQTYWPVFKYYHPSTFGRDDLAQMDYRALEMSTDDWAVWPVLKWDPLERNEKLDDLPSSPSSVNWLGTDDTGRDVAARLLYGFRYSMLYALGVWFLSSIFGILAGAVMGYAGGWVDLIGQRVIEVIESLPYLMILITLVSIFQPSLGLLVLLTVFFSWVIISIYFRAEFLRLRKLDFVDAARSLGSSRARLIFRHILPNSLTPWITITPFIIAAQVSGLAALDFLGFGLPAPTPSWGELLNQALKHFRDAWWLAVFPSGALFLTLTFLNLIGEGVRDAFDPRR